VGQAHPTMALAGDLEERLPGHRFSLGYFEPLAWQLLFGAAFLVGRGAARKTLPAWLGRPPRALWIACLGGAALLAFQRYCGLPLPADFVKRWTAAQTLAPLRLLNVFCVAVVARAHWAKLSPALSWKPLRVIGSESLAVFYYHIIAVYVLTLALGPGASLPLLCGALLVALLLTYPVALASSHDWLATMGGSRRETHASSGHHPIRNPRGI
jgi:hypothetical protein